MPDMRFGIASPYGSARAAARLAQQAEESGWDGFFLGDAIWCEDPMVALAAAAVSTRRIRLGTMVIPVPLRRPWKIASESVALDHLSEGRLILGLGAGAVWMGWQGFPDEVTDTKARAEMLDETIDILTLLYQRKQFDYDGVHYHLKLSQVEERHYPPKPVQQPRIPLWVPGIWPYKKSMKRTLKCDGIFPEVRGPDGQWGELTPDHVSQIKAFVDSNRTLSTPFDIVAQGKTVGLDAAQLKDKLQPLAEAGATWWIEGLWEMPEEQVSARLRQGPPRLS